jgi:hypothetical protein
LLHLDIRLRDKLYLQIGRRDPDRITLRNYQYVCQYRHGLPPFNDANDGLKRT